MRIFHFAAKYTAAILLLLLAANYAGAARKSACTVTVILEGSALAAAEAGEICRTEAGREDAQYVCFWGEEKNVSFSCQETGASARADLVLTAGNPELLLPGTAALHWQERGCCLDTGTAKRLFGTENAAGQVVWWEGEAYTVCGTFQSLRELVVRCAAGSDGEALTGVSLYLPRAGNRKREAEEFLLRCGQSGDPVDFFFLEALAEDLLLLLPMVLALRGVRWLLRKGRQEDALSLCQGQPEGGTLLCQGTDTLSRQEMRRGERTRGLGNQSGIPGGGFWWYLAAIILAGLAAWSVYQRFWIPADMVPTKWSDFSFWTEWWSGQRQNFLRILETAQGEAQMEVLWNLAASALLSICAAFLGALNHMPGASEP